MADLPELPQTITIDLDTPLKRGDDAIAALTFRRPTTVVLLDMSLIQLGLVDMDVMRDLLTRTSTVGLIGEEVDKIDGADMLQIAREVSDFFQIEDFEDLEIKIEGDIVTIPLVKPIIRGETTLDELRLRRPDSGSFRSLSLARIGQMETRSLAGLLPRISMTPLTEADTHAIDPVDWMRIANEVGDFLLPRRRRTA